LFGVILLVVGSITQYYNRIYVEFVGYKVFVIPIVIIGLGTLIFLISIIGCCGSIRENYVVLLAFAGVLMGACLAEATLTLVAYMSRFE
uniref:Tetraspanin n=1 Tax=Romanomermis culicivorax TaxID=13658 RepID=A0A915LCN3_ROMCU